MTKTLFALPFAALIPLLGACASASATGKAADRPDLVIPPPPSHVVPITPEPIVEPVGEVPSLPSTGAPKPPARPAAPRPAPDSRTEAKPGEVKPETPPETTPQPVPQPPAAPAPQLRTAESTTTQVAVRATIDRTKSILSTVDYRQLTNVRKRAYDDAKRFLQQAEDALKGGNEVFAKGVADKADPQAKQPAGG
jgi:hypothetical protein